MIVESSSFAHPFSRALRLAILCALFSPLAAWAQVESPDPNIRPMPEVWPQASLIEGKGPADKLVLDGAGAITTDGMPVPDPLQEMFDVLHYNLKLQIDPQFGWIAGTVDILFWVLDQPLEFFVLDFLDKSE